MEPKFSPPSKGAILGLKVIFFFPLLPLGAIVSAVVDFFLCKRGGEAGKEGFSANEKKAWRKIWCGFFFQCGCNGHGAYKEQQMEDWKKRWPEMRRRRTYQGKPAANIHTQLRNNPSRKLVA